MHRGSTTTVIVLAVAAIAGVFALFLGISGFSHYNTVIGQQNSTEAQWKTNQLNYDNMWKVVQETAQVAEQERSSFKEIFLGAMEGRYGDGGSQAVMQWITEHNPSPSPDLYMKVMSIIEAQRNTFTNGQQMLTDRQRVYKNTLQSPMGALLWNGVFGFPSEITGKYAPSEDYDGDGKLTALDYPIVTSAKTEQVFKTAQDNEPMDVFGKD